MNLKIEYLIQACENLQQRDDPISRQLSSVLLLYFLGPVKQHQKHWRLYKPRL